MLKHMYIVIYFLSYSRSTVRVKDVNKRVFPSEEILLI